MVPRVDVFSTKGGVGKTTLAFFVARAQAEQQKAPVLMVDADLSGTCLGNLLQPWVIPRWHEVQPDLVHLICDPPERLSDILSDPARLPIFECLPEAPVNDTAARRAVPGLKEPRVLFCPSHERSAPLVPLPVLHALIGHESAGGWVSTVIGDLIEAARRYFPTLAAVVVDHGPGIGSLQYATLMAMEEQLGSPSSAHRKALVVTTRDGVDLASAVDLDASLQSMRLRQQLVWVVNRVPRPSEGKNWHEAVTEGLLAENQPQDDWFTRRALPIYHDDALANAYRRSALHGEKAPHGLERLRVELFGE